MAKRRFRDAAGRIAWVDERGMVYTEGGKRATGYTKTEWDRRQLERWGGVSPEDIDKQLADQTAKAIIELEDKLQSIPNVSLTTEEMDAFLQKAIEQVTPYYEKKKKEIEAGIREGKIRTAEDVLSEIRKVNEEVNLLLKKYDIEEAQTEEEFINTLADITATKEEDLALKRADWKQRIDQAKMGQVQAGILTSGIGKSRIKDLLERKALEESAIERRAATKEEKLRTAKKYDLQRITLARQAAEQERIRRIGTPEQVAKTTAAARATIGLKEGEALPSEVEIERMRAERNITPRRPEELSRLEEERKRAIESRKQELQAEELAIRRERERRQRQQRENILAQLANKYSQLSSYTRRY